MIELVAEPFDSGLLKRRVHKLFVQSPSLDVNELRTALAKEKPEVAFAFVPHSRAIMEPLEDAGFRFISIRSTYTLAKDASTTAPALPNDFRLASLADKLAFSDDGLRAMALVIGGTSRYFHDSRINEQMAVDFYLTWIKNSLYRGYASEAFTLLKGDRLAGLITLKVKDRRGIIDLLGVSPEFQGAGLGGILLSRAIGYFRSRDIHDIVVVTEGENVKANIFYQRKGFLIKDVALVYHAHYTYE